MNLRGVTENRMSQQMRAFCAVMLQCSHQWWRTFCMLAQAALQRGDYHFCTGSICYLQRPHPAWCAATLPWYVMTGATILAPALLSAVLPIMCRRTRLTTELPSPTPSASTFSTVWVTGCPILTLTLAAAVWAPPIMRTRCKNTILYKLQYTKIMSFISNLL